MNYLKYLNLFYQILKKKSIGDDKNEKQKPFKFRLSQKRSKNN